ncbi:GNAT family N-acetyltransferase [Candidatus Regiella insecticola]|nr:GNAT family N-acetyltransferase [Candidatus Regiella insecticola]
MILSKKQFPKTIETKRFIGSMPTLSDLSEYYSMFQNKQFIACYGVAFSKEKINELVVSNINHWKQNGFGMWTWRDKESHHFIGRVGLKSITVEEKNEVELAYALKPEYWGKSVAIEMSLMAIALAFNTLSLPSLICFTRAQNYQSLRVMQKLDFHYEKDFIYLGFLQKLHRLANFGLNTHIDHK